MKNQKGFSLIELLIVVAIILIIAAIAIPNLLRARISANESSAAGSIRLIVNCAVTYQTAHPNIGFPAASADMGPGQDNCMDQVMVDMFGAGVPKSGYKGAYAATLPVGGVNTGFTANADPATCDRTGVKTYFADESGTIRFESQPGACPAATIASPPLQ